MALIEFRCPACGQTFQVPGERIPAGGARGRCKSCGAALQILPDGRALPATAPPPPPPPDEPIWGVKIHGNQNNVDVMNGLTLAQVRELILVDRLLDSDHLKVLDGEWTPAGAFPALTKFFAERLEQLRELHGDSSHCARHKDVPPQWQCLKCGDYLCESCVVNRPLMAGGEDRYLCLGCDFETRTLERKGRLTGALKGILTKR